jgi:hypothetical protein
MDFPEKTTLIPHFARFQWFLRLWEEVIYVICTKHMDHIDALGVAITYSRSMSAGRAPTGCIFNLKMFRRNTFGDNISRLVSAALIQPLCYFIWELSPLHLSWTASINLFLRIISKNLSHEWKPRCFIDIQLYLAAHDLHSLTFKSFSPSSDDLFRELLKKIDIFSKHTFAHRVYDPFLHLMTLSF